MELIKIRKSDVGKETVSARDLWKFLESKQQFSNWIQNRIEQYDFAQGIDFIKLNEFINSDSKPIVEYHLLLDMAKELSMIERNDKGKQARKYFIECEKKAKGLTALPTYPEALRQLADSLEDNKQLTQKIEKDQPKIEFAESIRHTKATVTIQEFAKILCQEGLKTGQNRLFATLREFGILMPNNTPYQRYIDNEWMTLDEFPYIRKDGSESISKRSLIMGKGQVGILNKLTKNP